MPKNVAVNLKKKKICRKRCSDFFAAGLRENITERIAIPMLFILKGMQQNFLTPQPPFYLCTLYKDLLYRMLIGLWRRRVWGDFLLIWQPSTYTTFPTCLFLCPWGLHTTFYRLMLLFTTHLFNRVVIFCQCGYFLPIRLFNLNRTARRKTAPLVAVFPNHLQNMCIPRGLGIEWFAWTIKCIFIPSLWMERTRRFLVLSLIDFCF